jgi:hypothetical protein
MMREMKRYAAAAVLAACSLCGPAGAQVENADDRPTVIVMVGAPGEDRFGTEFYNAADAWTETCKRANVNFFVLGNEPEVRPAASAPAGAASTPATALAPTMVAASGPAKKTDRQRFQEILAAQAKGTKPLWIVLLGHGTFDGREAKFALRELDFSDTELAAWLKPMSRPIALIDGTSASGTFLTKLSGPNRVIITATRAGSETNYARFGNFMAQYVANPAADMDKDGQTSLLESYLVASRATQDFYQSQGRLATEHAVLDDTGDSLGTPAENFQGTRAVRAPRPARGGAPTRGGAAAAPGGARAHQWFLIPSADELALNPQARAQRDAIELQIESLRQRKANLTDPEYYAQLDALLVSLARIQIRTNLPENR